MSEERYSCIVAGGGPAGMMLGLLLARAGVHTLVLEKHRDFLRDFRGDTVHPSTLEILAELDMLDRFLARPHNRVQRIAASFGDRDLCIADFSRLKVHAPFIAMTPQWEFLDFLAGEARVFPAFALAMEHEVVGLIERAGCIAGVTVRTCAGERTIRADLVVAADGRHSRLRAAAGLSLIDLGAPIDVLWLRLSKRPADGAQSLGRFAAGHAFVAIDRGSYWQCAYVIPKGGIDAIRVCGLDAFRCAVAQAAPFLADRVDEIASWDEVKLLSVRIDRLTRWWRSGLLAIGDAAHAMSPVGGVGINLAVQDAVAAANRLWLPLRRHIVTDSDLAAIEKRRRWPTVATQWLQIQAHRRLLAPTLAGRPPSPPLPMQLLDRWPALRGLSARLIGMGVRPERVRVSVY